MSSLVTVILLVGSGVICVLHFKVGHRIHPHFHLLQRDWKWGASQSSGLTVKRLSKLCVNQASQYYLIPPGTAAESEGGIRRIPEKRARRDSAADVRTDKSFINARPSNESFLSYQVGGGGPPVNAPFSYRSFYLVCSFAFRPSAGFPHTQPHWHRYVVARREENKGTHSFSRPDKSLTQIWTRRSPVDSAGWYLHGQR